MIILLMSMIAHADPTATPTIYASTMVVVTWQDPPTVYVPASHSASADFWDLAAPTTMRQADDGTWHVTFTTPVVAPYIELILTPERQQVDAIVPTNGHGEVRHLVEGTQTAGTPTPYHWFTLLQ